MWQNDEVDGGEHELWRHQLRFSLWVFSLGANGVSDLIQIATM